MRVSLRGITENEVTMNDMHVSNPTVAINVDGAFNKSSTAGQNLFDIERVEVLAGPLAGSPKFHSQATMVPAAVVDESENWVGSWAQAVLAAKLATGLGVTLTVWPPWTLSMHPPALVTISLTVNTPPEVNMCTGFCRVDVLFVPEAGSPKFQLQAISGGPPLSWERSVNGTGAIAQAPVPALKLANGWNST